MKRVRTLVQMRIVRGIRKEEERVRNWMRKGKQKRDNSSAISKKMAWMVIWGRASGEKEARRSKKMMMSKSRDDKQIGCSRRRQDEERKIEARFESERKQNIGSSNLIEDAMKRQLRQMRLDQESRAQRRRRRRRRKDVVEVRSAVGGH